MTWWLKLRRRRQLEHDLDDEIAFHRAMRSGDVQAPAFGNETQIREATRDLWRFRWIETTCHDVRYALRSLWGQPGFSIVVVLTLALGIGANTAVFSVVNGVVLRPLPYPEPDRLEYVMTQFLSLGFDRFDVSVPEFLELSEHAEAFESLGAYTTGTVTLGTASPSRQRAAAVTAGLWPTLGVQPLLGRWLDAEDSRPGADPVTVLSFDLWQSEFGSDPSIVGQRIAVNDISAIVAGVMPRGFDVHDEGLMLWVPLTIDPTVLPDRRADHLLGVIGRRKAGVDSDQVQADMNRLLARWREIAPQGHVPVDPQHRIATTPLLDDIVDGTRGVLWLLQGAVALVLILVCVNLANLLIARADSREQEHALRAALGASRWRLLRQMTTEGLVLALGSAVIGTALAQTGLTLLLSAYPDVLPRIGDISIDVRVLAFAVAVTLVVAVVFGIVPFAHLAKDRLAGALKASGQRTIGAAGRARVRTLLIVSEVALAVLLVTGAGLLLRSFVNLTHVDVGFDRAGLSTFAVAVPGTRYDPAARVQFFDRLVTAVGALPGVSAATTMTGLPTERSLNASDMDFAHIPNDRPPDVGPVENVDYFQTVSLGFVETMGVRVVAGRNFEPVDTNGPPAVLVNEALVRKFFGNQDPIGQQVRRGFGDDSPWLTVVGVIEDIKHDGVAADPGTEVYFLHEQDQRARNVAAGSVYVAVRSLLPLEALAPQFRRVVAELDPTIPVTEVRTMDEAIGQAISQPRFLLLLVGLMAGLALALAAVGIYGILAYLVAERNREFGVRMALGATRRDVVRLVVGRGLGATLVGLSIGVVCALSMAHLLTSLLFGVTPNDPTTLAGVCALLLLVAVIACIVPAWRASRVSPSAALR